MANESKLLQICTKKLESMNQITVDSRPKTLSKLKNTLEKERQVIYLNDCLKHLLKMDCQKCSKGKRLKKICRPDKEVDKEIVVYAREAAAARSRQLFVLPSDSPLHRDVIKNIKTWYESRETARVDPNCPSRDLAACCLVESSIDHKVVVKALQTIGLLKIEKKIVLYKNLDVTAQEVLKKAFDRWCDQMYTSLSSLSVASYRSFGLLIKDANDEIQGAVLKEMNNYCCAEITTWYPRLSRTDDVMETEYTAHDNNESDGRHSSSAKESDCRKKCINQPMFVWPVSLEPEIAFVLLRLFETENKPKTLVDFENFIKINGNVMYVVSPKPALLEIGGADGSFKSSKTPGAKVTLNIYMGSVSMDNLADLDTARWLASVLTVPGKNKRPKKTKMETLVQDFVKMDTSTDDVKGQLSQFQRFVLNNAKSLAQRTGSLLLYDDAEADERCRDGLIKYVEMNSGDNKEEFSKNIVKICCEHSSIPVENLVSLLVNEGYLEINEMDETVHYRKGMYFHKPTEEDTLTENRYLHEWEEFYKPIVEEKLDAEPIAKTSTGSRKRRSSSDSNGEKRQKCADDIFM